MLSQRPFPTASTPVHLAAAPGEAHRLTPRWIAPWDLLQFIRRPTTFFSEAQSRFGDTYLLKAPRVGRLYVTSDPAVVKAVFTHGPDVVEQPSADLLGDLIGEESVLVATGNAHKRLRQLLIPAFKGERMRALEGRMQLAAEERAAQWTTGQRFDIHGEMEEVALDVILSVVLGMEGSRQLEVRALIQELLHKVTADLMFVKALRVDLGPFTRFGQLVKARQRLDALILEEMAERRATGVDRGCVLDSMLAVRDEDGRPMPDAEILDQALTLLVAGHETTATGLAWTFFHVLANPDILVSLQDELARTGTGAQTLSSSPLLENICRESLRLTPVIPEAPRLITRRFEAGGVVFEEGARLIVAIAALHQRADLFEDPTVFRPSRFEDHHYAPWEYAPFGGGVRKCLGWAFALQQMRIVLGTTLATWDLSLIDKASPEPRRRNLSVGPHGGVVVEVGPSKLPA